MVEKGTDAPSTKLHVMTTLLAVDKTTGTAAAARKEVVSSKDATTVNETKETGSTMGISNADTTAT